MAMSVTMPGDVGALGDGVERGGLAVEVFQGQCKAVIQFLWGVGYDRCIKWWAV